MRTGRRPNLVQRSVEMADIRKLWFAGLLFVALQGSAVCCFQASRGDVSRTTRSHGRMVLPESQALDFFVAASKPLEDSTSSILLAAASNLVSPEPIHSAFSIATFLPQPFWLLMTLLPNNATTKNLMGGLEIPLLCCLVHFFIVVSSIIADGSEATAPLAEFSEVFNPSGDPQKAFMGMTSSYPNFVAEEWSHVLTWDLFIGRYIWLDGLKRGIFTAPAVLFCNLIGPPGLLIHWITCIIARKPIFEPSEKEATMEEWGIDSDKNN